MASILDKAGTNVGNAYKLISASPLDVRFTVADTEERDSIITANGCYPGLEVWVSSENKKYRAVPSGTSFVWKEIGTMEDIPDITFPDITITDTGTKPIVGDITADGHTITVSRIGLDDLGLASAYKYKGSVAAYANLPATGNTEGDVYNVQTDGMNYAWTGSAWDALGGTVDLSNYVTLDGTQTITGNKTFTGNVVTSNNKFEIKANSNTDDSWIKLTNKSDSGYYAFGIRRPYDSYGLQLKIHGTDGTDTYHDIWHAGNDGSSSGLDADLLDGKHANEFANYNEGIFYVEGTSETAGTWLGSNSRITEYYDGLIILYKINQAGASTTTLNINNLGAKTVYRYGSTKVTTHFSVNSIIVLSYMADLNSGCWMVLSSYDSTNVDQLRPSYARFYTADALYDYKICGIDKDGRLRPLTITEGTGTSKTVNTAAIRPNEFYYYSTTTNVAAGGIVAANYIYYVYSHTTFHYTFNSTGTTYCEIYLKGTLDSTTGLFTLDTTSATSWYTLVPYNTTITLSDYFVNGSYYILLGRTYSSNNYFTLFPNHPLYKFDGTNLKEIILEAVNADTLDGKHASEFLTAESDTLQTVTTRGATTDKAITTAGLTTTSTLYITGTTGHREGIRIAPVGNLSSIWWNATGTQDYTTGQMWGITAYDKNYTSDATKTNTFRFRGPQSSTATSATDQMWINTAGLVTARGGFEHGSLTASSGKTKNDYVLLAGGGTKAVSDFATSSVGSGYLPLTGSSTNSATNNMTGPILFKDSSGIILNSNNQDVNVWSVWGNSGSYAEEFGFHLQYKGTGSGNDNTLHLYAHNQTGTNQEVYTMTQDGKTTWKQEINFTGTIKESGTALSSKYLGISAKAADADKLDGQDGSYYLNYDNFTNTPTIPDPEDYYWANVKVSKTSSTSTTPTFSTIVVNNANATNHITLQRDGWNYVSANAGTSATIAFIAGNTATTPAGANASLAIQNTALLPGLRDNAVSLGGTHNSTKYHFKDLYLKGTIYNGDYSYTLPSKTGTLALTSDIKAGTVTSIGMTVPTGLSVSPASITTSGTFAITYASGYAIPTTTKQSNWDTAYGWGDHSKAGYIKSFTDTKNTAGAINSDNPLYLIGAESQTANPQTYSNSAIYATAGTLTTTKTQVGGGQVTMEYDGNYKALKFVFA